MTLQYLLDTSIVSAPVSKTPNPQIVKRLEEHSHESAIAAPVWHELIYGCGGSPRVSDATRSSTTSTMSCRSRFQSFRMTRLPPRGTVMSAPVSRALVSPRRSLTGQIAAIAHASDLVLVTANVKDFARFKGLQVTNWSKP